jgi:signal transduction histidine kinase
LSPFVLYVDDDTSNLVVFETGLKGELPVLTARSGAEALEVLRHQEVAVLLTDQRMPGMSGVELIEKVRAEYPDTIRMLVTAYSDIEAAIGAINRGQVHLYLRKPWEPVELKLTLTQARERYIAGRRVRELEQRLTATERMYALGVIAAGVAHEIRTPLTALMMNLELVQVLLDGAPSPAGAAQMRTSVNDAVLAVRAITDITNSIELSTRSRTDTQVDLREVVELACRSVKGEARRRGKLDVHLAPVPAVWGSRTRLGQVALNLLVNALEALEPSTADRNLVKVRVYPDGQKVAFSVEDNGPGIEPAVARRIFDPLFTTKSEGGTGLGLAISRQILQELGGTIDVTTELGRGTTFVVHLPLRPSPR